MIAFEFDELRLESEHEVSDALDAYIRITGTFRIRSNSRVVYEEEAFPVLELAADLLDWERRDLPQNLDFEFDSMSTPESGWVWLRKEGEEGFRIGSIHQISPDMSVHKVSEVRQAIRTFLESFMKAAILQLRMDISRYLPQQD